MEISVLVSKILSLAYLSVGFGILLSPNYYKNELNKMIGNSPFLLISGFIALVFGVLIIEYQNTWNRDWTTAITIIGWIALIKGIGLLIFPRATASIYRSTILKSEYVLLLLVPLLFIIGGIFGYFGFIR